MFCSAFRTDDKSVISRPGLLEGLSLKSSRFVVLSLSILIIWAKNFFCCRSMNTSSPSVLHNFKSSSFVYLKLQESFFLLKPPFTIFLNIRWYIEHIFSFCFSVSVQVWQEYVNLLLTRELRI